MVQYPPRKVEMRGKQGWGAVETGSWTDQKPIRFPIMPGYQNGCQKGQNQQIVTTANYKKPISSAHFQAPQL